MKKPRRALILIALYVLALGIRVYWLSQKEGMHVDEGLTVALACYNDYMVTANYEFGEKYTGKEIKEASLASDASLKGALADIRDLWKDNRDPPHTNLYYSLLRISLIGLKSGEMPQLVLRGGILNLLFFTVSFIFFFLLMRLLFPGVELLQYAAVFCAFLSTASISNTLFIRPYQLQETLFIIFCYYFVLNIGWMKCIIHERKLFFSIKQIAFMAFVTAVTLLTGYYTVLFIGLFGIFAIFLLCRTKRFAEIPFYFVVLCFGIVFAQVLYPKYVSGFFSYRGNETIKTITENMAENIRTSIMTAGTFLHKHFFTWPLIIVCVLCFAYTMYLLIRDRRIYDKKTYPAMFKMTWYIFAVSILYLLIVLIIAPYKVLRYGMPVFPFLVILPAMLIYFIGEKSRKIAAVAMLLLCACSVWNATREKNIENIFRNKPDEYVFAKDKDTPVYVLNARWSLWKYANLIPYLNDEQEYYFIDWYPYFDGYMRSGQKRIDLDLPEVEEYESVYLVYEYFPDFLQYYDFIDSVLLNLQTQHGTFLEIDGEFEINTAEPESWFPYFKGKKIIMQ